MTLTDDELRGLVGYAFPGGHYRVAHWENWLLTDCTGADPLPDAIVHPVALFHAPILGSRTSIAELFALFHAEGAGSVGLLGYDWEYFGPLREDIDYRCEGGILEAQRYVDDNGRISDEIAFRIELLEDGRLAARITNRWRFRRSPT